MIICVVSGLMLIVKGILALLQKKIRIKKNVGFPWRFEVVKREQSPRKFFLASWSSIALGVFFVLFPFVIPYFV